MNTQTQEALKMAIEQMNVYAHIHLCEHQCQDEELLDVIQACKEALEHQEVGEAEIKQMLNDIEYYQKRVEELEQPLTRDWKETIDERIAKDDAFKQALEQPAQEPVMNVTLSCGCKSSELGFPSEWAGETRKCEPCINYGMLCIKHFYEWEARPAQIHPAPLQNEFAKTKSWQGLESEKVTQIIHGLEDKLGMPIVGAIAVARAIEAKLKEKNA